ncbi:hypothetical protein BDR26DRAFT_866993 [Obelidium mucronatum]|nr:hypothetical protein BDR26DRAFT_866993 [Obelidium mucronatum]
MGSHFRGFHAATVLVQLMHHAVKTPVHRNPATNALTCPCGLFSTPSGQRLKDHAYGCTGVPALGISPPENSNTNSNSNSNNSSNTNAPPATSTATSSNTATATPAATASATAAASLEVLAAPSPVVPPPVIVVPDPPPPPIVYTVDASIIPPLLADGSPNTQGFCAYIDVVQACFPGVQPSNALQKCVQAFRTRNNIPMIRLKSTLNTDVHHMYAGIPQALHSDLLHKVSRFSEVDPNQPPVKRRKVGASEKSLLNEDSVVDLTGDDMVLDGVELVGEGGSNLSPPPPPSLPPPPLQPLLPPLSSPIVSATPSTLAVSATASAPTVTTLPPILPPSSSSVQTPPILPPLSSSVSSSSSLPTKAPSSTLPTKPSASSLPTKTPASSLPTKTPSQRSGRSQRTNPSTPSAATKESDTSKPPQYQISLLPDEAIQRITPAQLPDGSPNTLGFCSYLDLVQLHIPTIEASDGLRRCVGTFRTKNNVERIPMKSMLNLTSRLRYAGVPKSLHAEMLDKVVKFAELNGLLPAESGPPATRPPTPPVAVSVPAVMENAVESVDDKVPVVATSAVSAVVGEEVGLEVKQPNETTKEEAPKIPKVEENSPSEVTGAASSSSKSAGETRKNIDLANGFSDSDMLDEGDSMGSRNPYIGRVVVRDHDDIDDDGVDDEDGVGEGKDDDEDDDDEVVEGEEVRELLGHSESSGIFPEHSDRSSFLKDVLNEEMLGDFFSIPNDY